ncbi:MAG: BMP family ABC transporter substrate-binding protein [Thermomicrobiales bacterium]|nr:BMP family ABC transporter substrate-binding protein [Thermomicrobiales bacterium]
MSLANAFVSRRSILKAAAIAPAVAVLGYSGVSAQDQLVVTMVTDTAGLGDQNFNDLAKRGLDRSVDDFDVKGQVIESRDAAAYVPNLIQAAENSALTIGVGFLLTEAMVEVAKEYPDAKFQLIDSVAIDPDTSEPVPNVASVTFKEQEAAFLAGVAAAMVSASHKIGAVAGMKIPPVVRYAVGYEAGAKSANPETEVIVAYADTFDDPALGKELTLAQYNQGADIAFAIAGKTGVGCFDAAKEKGAGFWVIAADADQAQLGADFQLCVAAKGIDTAVVTVVQEVVDDEFKGGVLDLGLKEGGVDLLNPGGHVPNEVMALVDRYKQAIIDGTLVVPADEEQLAVFKPVAPDAIGAAATPSS